MTRDKERTALKRKVPSAPARTLSELGLIRPPALDYGSGYGMDAARLGMDAYDPFHGPKSIPQSQYNTILMTYVLNTLHDRLQQEALSQALKHLKSKGKLYATVRTDKKNLKGTTSKGTYQTKVKLPHPVAAKGSGFKIYEVNKSMEKQSNVWNKPHDDAEDPDVLTLRDLNMTAPEFEKRYGVPALDMHINIPLMSDKEISGFRDAAVGLGKKSLKDPGYKPPYRHDDPLMAAMHDAYLHLMANRVKQLQQTIPHAFGYVKQAMFKTYEIPKDKGMKKESSLTKTAQSIYHIKLAGPRIARATARPLRPQATTTSGPQANVPSHHIMSPSMHAAPTDPQFMPWLTQQVAGIPRAAVGSAAQTVKETGQAIGRGVKQTGEAIGAGYREAKQKIQEDMAQRARENYQKKMLNQAVQNRIKQQQPPPTTTTKTIQHADTTKNVASNQQTVAPKKGGRMWPWLVGGGLGAAGILSVPLVHGIQLEREKQRREHAINQLASPQNYAY